MARYKIFYSATVIDNNQSNIINLEMSIDSDTPVSRQAAVYHAQADCARLISETGKTHIFNSLQTVIQVPEFKEIKSAVYPNKNNTVQVLVDDEYKGAHVYKIQNSLGYDKESKEAKYDSTTQEIQFIQKNSDGSVIPGIQTEQLLWVLLDRHAKLNEKFPDPNYEEFVKGIQMAINAQAKRVKERQERGVMGELQK